MTESNQRGRLLRRSFVAFLASTALAATLIGCASSATPTANPSSTAGATAGTAPLPASSSPTTRTTPTTAVPVDGAAARVTVGRHLVNVLCTGTDNTKTTIVLVAGLPDPLTKFTSLQATLGKNARVCSYDRLGEGASAKPSGPQTLSDSAAVLDGVLNAEKISGKVVVVGHSLGGTIAAQFAHQYPARVAAVVLLDAAPPSEVSAIQALIPASATGIPAGARGEVSSLSAANTNPEQLVFTGQPLGSLGDIPLTVVQHGLPIYAVVPKYGTQLQAIWTAGQKRFAQLSSDSQLITATKSGHYIYLDQQALAVQLIEHASAG